MGQKNVICRPTQVLANGWHFINDDMYGPTPLETPKAAHKYS